MRKILFSIGGIVLAFLLSATFWLDRQFEEPVAKHVSSLTDEYSARSIMAIFAHPDDEQLITGLLLQASEEEELQSTILTFTKGEPGTQMPKIARDSELGIIRYAELLKNGYALGVTQQIVWDYPDGGVKDEDFQQLITRVEEEISTHKPDMIITFWPASGFSNHDDHKTVGRVVTTAVKNAHAKNPATAPKSIAYILAPRGMMGRFAGDNGKYIAKHQPPPTHSIDGQGWAKIRGWDIHASQRNYVKKAYGLPPGIIHRLYDKEHYYVVTQF